MSMTPTTPVIATDKQGKAHDFLMGFAAKRAIQRRMRAMMVKGEMASDLEQVNTLDNFELGYITLWQCRLEETALSEDAFLEQFPEAEILKASNELWQRYRSDSGSPTNPGAGTSSPTNGTTTTVPGASGVSG